MTEWLGDDEVFQGWDMERRRKAVESLVRRGLLTPPEKKVKSLGGREIQSVPALLKHP